MRPTFTPAEVALYERRLEEGYDLKTDEKYNTWLKLQGILCFSTVYCITFGESASRRMYHNTMQIALSVECWFSIMHIISLIYVLEKATCQNKENEGEVKTKRLAASCQKRSISKRR